MSPQCLDGAVVPLSFPSLTTNLKEKYAHLFPLTDGNTEALASDPTREGHADDKPWFWAAIQCCSFCRRNLSPLLRAEGSQRAIPLPSPEHHVALAHAGGTRYWVRTSPGDCTMLCEEGAIPIPI